MNTKPEPSQAPMTLHELQGLLTVQQQLAHDGENWTDSEITVMSELYMRLPAIVQLVQKLEGK